jgi:hypothetical protein
VITAVWIALATIATCIAGLVTVAWRLGTLDGNGGHTRRNVRRRADVPFADPADRADPDGEQYAAQLRAAGRLPYVTDEMLTRVREGLLGVQPDGTSATFTPAPGVTMPVSDDPDTTGVQLAAVATWGMTASEKADELAARYLT